MKKRNLIIVVSLFIFIGCFPQTDAKVASHNLSKAADMFEINRRVVFYNGITDKYILVIEGRCSVDFYQNKFVVTVKTGPNEYKKHYLGRADNVFPFVEQLESSNTNVYNYRVVFKPQAVIPAIDMRIK